MKHLKKNFWLFFRKQLSLISLLIVTLSFFYKIFLGFYPLPADLLVGTYLPWTDYKWGRETIYPVKNPITSDAISFSYPMRTLAIDMLTRFEVPLWNPYILAGTPLMANFQSAPFTITNIFYILFNSKFSWALQVITQHVLATCGMYILLRRWKISAAASVFSSIIFAFSGFNLIWSEWNAHTLAAAFTPLLIYFIDRWGNTGRYKYGVGVSLIVCLQILSGYPQIMYYIFLLLSVFWILKYKEYSNWFQKSLGFTFFVLIGLLLSSFQSLPALEIIKLSQRNIESIPKEWAFLSWQQVITFIAPDFFGNHATANYWGPKNYTTVVGFVGVTAFTLACLCIAKIKLNKNILIFTIVALISCLLAFPTPIAVWFWNTNFLGMKASVSHRSLVLFVFSVAILSGYGFDIIFNSKYKLSKWFIFPTTLLVGFFGWSILNYAGILKTTSSANSYISLRNLVIPFFCFILFILVATYKNKIKNIDQNFFKVGVILIMLVEVFYFGWKFTPFSSEGIIYPQTPIIVFLQSQTKPFRVEPVNTIPTNLLIPYHIETVSGYDAVYPLTTAKFLGVMNSGDFGAAAQDRYGIVTNHTTKLLNLFNVKYFVAAKNNSLFTTKQYKKVFEDKSLAIFENQNVIPRYQVYYDWEVVKDDNLILKKLVDPKYPIERKLIVSESIDISPSPNTTPSPVIVTSYSTNYVDLYVNAKTNGVLFASDAYYPGWYAYVDGNKKEITPTNYMFRGLAISQGEHVVRFIYQPNSFVYGIKISMLAFLFLLFGYPIYIIGMKTRKRYT